jgi:hypothetical protein
MSGVKSAGATAGVAVVLARTAGPTLVVVNEQRIVLGHLGIRMAQAAGGTRVEDVTAAGPTTGPGRRAAGPPRRAHVRRDIDESS